MFKKLRKYKLLIFIVIILEIVLVVSAFFIAYNYPSIIPFYQGNELIYHLGFSILLIIILMVVYIRTFNMIEKRGKQNYIDTKTIMSADIKEAYQFGEIGLLSYDENGEIVWMSELFSYRNINAIGLLVQEWLPTVRIFFKKDYNVNQVKVELGNRIYSVMHLPDLKLMLFKDVTELENIYKTYHEQSIVFATVVIDNLDDISPNSDDNEIRELENKVRKTITDWARHYGVVLRRIRDDTYFAILQEGILRKIINSNFKINDEVRKFTTSDKDQLTLSIGIGRGTNDLMKIAELSSLALDVALSRGGDQTVINNYGGRLEFFGGKTQSKEKSNTVKMRILSKSLSTHIISSKQVYIMGHKDSDFDAIGAALGVVAMCQQYNVPAYIIFDEKQIESKARAAFRELFSRADINEMTITSANAIDKLNDDTLLIVVDTHRPSNTISPQLVAASKRTALIDHHRRSEEFIDDLLLSILEPSASSTSELVAELIKYSPQSISMSSEFATYMLTGILLDTNRYRVRTSARTFEASMILKEFGASIEIADEFLKDEYEEYQQKTKILSNISIPAYGIIVATSPDDEIVERSILAKIAQDALQIKGIKASFVIGNIDNDTVQVSARSDGTVNVQLLIEKMGGGGHFSSAAAQLTNTTITQAEERLNDVIKLYLDEVQS